MRAPSSHVRIFADQRPATTRLRVAVGIATVGRPVIVAQLVSELRHQSRPPDSIFVCAPTAGDVFGLTDSVDLKVLVGPNGLTRQRNAILDQLDDYDFVFFLDDDFIPHRCYIEQCEAIFRRRPEVVMTTGKVIADGILGPGLTFSAAQIINSAAEPNVCRRPMTEVVYNAYGCNMGIRLAPVRRRGVQFDERLPLYGWLEDVDFSRTVAAYGSILKVNAAAGVHLGVKNGRQSGMRLGYSQIVNPLYLARKGTCSWTRALYLMSRNLAANVLKIFCPEPYVDRAGRFRGNCRALLDLLAGRTDPSRVLTL